MRRIMLTLAGAGLVWSSAQAQQAGEVSTLPSGARWQAERPANWNGTLLLWSRGYSMKAGDPEIAPAPVRAALLAAGYALAGSDYGSGGWALEQAVPAQIATVKAFAARYGKPKRVIGWGYSMGGLVTTALAERKGARVIDGGIAMCASIGGAVGMMNMGLDGAFAFRTLVAPDAGIELVAIAQDDRANGQRVAEAVAAAGKTPEGRARMALAGVLGGLPGWATRGSAEPGADDGEAQAAELASSIVMGLFMPRNDQEKRAGGAFSWNTGVDYRAQLALSGRRGLIETLYRKAGLDLDADLARLNAAPRAAAAPKAVRYMMAHYAPNARPQVPLLAVQAKGDGATSPSMQQAYAEAAPPSRFASLWLNQAGHCGFAAPDLLAALRHLEARLESGRWPVPAAPFVAYRAPPMLRPCFRGKACR